MIEILKDPAQLFQLSVPQRLLGSLQVVGIGLGVTFLVLLVLMLCINIFSALAGRKKAESGPSAPAAAPAAPVSAAPAAPAASTASADVVDEETVAAIFAAISMIEGSSTFRIVNIAPAQEPSSWASQALSEAFAARGSQLQERR